MTTGTADQLQAGDHAASPVRVGETVAGKYVVERTLGVGGMGVVVAARDCVLDRPVAIKFLLPKLASAESSVQRFVREARAATRVTSEHVVRLLEIDKLPSGTPFFVMEYLEGSDLRALLRERGPLAPTLAVDYVLQALQAVAEGHLKGIVHRDIKPGNLLLTSRADGTPLIKVLDFGIAKTLESDAAESTALTSSDDVRLGSPAYMPPEQLQNPRDVDTRSDIWALGATLYELLSGRPPFEGPGYLELATRILSAEPTPLSAQQLEHPLPRGLQYVIDKCLQKDRTRRYENAAELADALAPFGSEDARVSLTRVKGMWGSHSLSAMTTSVISDSGAIATTLSVDGARRRSGSNADLRRTSDIGPVRARRSARSWIVVGAVSLGVALTLALREVAPPASPGSTSAVATEPVAATELAAAAVSPMASPALAAPPAPAGAGATPSGGGPASAAPSSAPVRSSKVRATRLGAVSPVTSVSAVTPPETAAQPSATKPPDAAPVLPGRLPEIERLIEQRR